MLPSPAQSLSLPSWGAAHGCPWVTARLPARLPAAVNMLEKEAAGFTHPL